MLSTGPKRILLASALGLAFGYSSIGVISFSVFVGPLSQEFGWGRGDMSLAFTLMSITIVLLAPFAGMLLDRYGVRRILIPAILCFGIVIASLSLLTGSIVHFYCMYLLMALSGVCTTPTSYSRVVVAWFDRNRGLALGIVLAGIGAGTALIPPFAQLLTSQFGWRSAYLGLGLLVCLVSLPAVVAWLREPVGLTSHHSRSVEEGFSFQDSIRRPQFLLLVISFVLLGIMTGGMLGHLVPILVDRGVAPSVAATVASFLGVSLIGARLLTGYLMDRFFAPIVAVIFLTGPVMGVVIFMSSLDGVYPVLAVILVGLGIGAEMDFMSYLVSRYFGLRAFSRLYGLLYSCLTIGISIGPVVMGYSHQYGGTYDAGLKALLVVSVLAIIPFFMLGKYPALPSSTHQLPEK